MTDTPKTLEFSVASEKSTLAHYRREWTPSASVSLGGIWHGAVVSDEKGNQYWGIRGTDDFVSGMTHVVSPLCGFRSLDNGFDGQPAHLFDEYSGIDWFEPMTYTVSDDLVHTGFPSGRIERDQDGLHWYDASGRWEIHGRTVSDVVLTRVPVQPGIDHEVYYRHELLYATGQINGVAVSGYAHQDYAYGPSGMIYTELPIARQLQGMWVSWLHQYGDGELGGGSFWQGRDERPFGPGYRVQDGLTVTHEDVLATPAFDGAGKMVTLDVQMGSQSYSFAFDTIGSPVHYFGSLVESSGGREPLRSWCWVEHAGPMMTPEILDIFNGQYQLARGR
ncbi:MAG: hypothetical protein U5N53_00245 [Mycobacterium sp.]|nr:hypothetical protein [Mycobacterium sp.]